MSKSLFLNISDFRLLFNGHPGTVSTSVLADCPFFSFHVSEKKNKGSLRFYMFPGDDVKLYFGFKVEKGAVTVLYFLSIVINNKNTYPARIDKVVVGVEVKDRNGDWRPLKGSEKWLAENLLVNARKELSIPFFNQFDVKTEEDDVKPRHRAERISEEESSKERSIKGKNSAERTNNGKKSKGESERVNGKKKSKDEPERTNGERKSKDGPERTNSERKSKDGPERTNSERKSKDGPERTNSERKSKDGPERTINEGKSKGESKKEDGKDASADETEKVNKGRPSMITVKIDNERPQDGTILIDEINDSNQRTGGTSTKNEKISADGEIISGRLSERKKEIDSIIGRDTDRDESEITIVRYLGEEMDPNHKNHDTEVPIIALSKEINEEISILGDKRGRRDGEGIENIKSSKSHPKN